MMALEIEEIFWFCEIQDGFTIADGDCDDSNSNIYPTAEEVCDGLDNDCNNDVDEDVGYVYYLDNDNDGYGGDISIISCSQQDHLSEQSGDCNDQDTEISPNKEEICDGLDNDCNGQVDDGASMFGIEQYFDGDGDGYGSENPMIIFVSCRKVMFFSMEIATMKIPKYHRIKKRFVMESIILRTQKWMKIWRFSSNI